MYATSWIISAESLLASIPVTLFLWFGGQDMQHILIVGLVFSVLSVVLTLFVPESPKYLYERGKYDELRENLAYIARFNGKSMGEYEILTMEQEDQGNLGVIFRRDI